MSNPISVVPSLIKDLGTQDINELTTALSGLAKEVRTLGRLTSKDFTGLSKGLAEVNAEINKLKATAGTVNPIDPKAFAELQKLYPQLKKLAEAQKEIKDAQAGQTQTAKVAAESLAGLRAEAKKVQEQFSKLDPTLAADAEKMQKLAAYSRQLTERTNLLSSATRKVNSEFSAAKGSYYELENRTKKLTIELKNLGNGMAAASPQAAKLRAEIARNTDALKSFDKELNMSFRNVGNYPTVFAKAQAGVAGFSSQIAGTYLGLQALSNASRFVLSSNIALSDSQADVRRTTGLTTNEVDALTESLEKVNTRTATAELLNISTIAGQLGVEGKRNVEGFTKAIDVAVVGLKGDFQGGAEEIATNLGKINNVFKLSDEVGLEKSLLNIGSALNEVGAKGAATAGFVADVALRIGAVAKNADIGLDKVFAYAATLEGLGYSAEVSGTALNNLIGKMAANSEGFFKIAKMGDAKLTLKEFTDFINTDADQALQLFFQGLNKGGDKTTEFNSLLEDLKIRGANARAVITSLAKNTDEYQRYQKIANEQLKNGTSLSTEAAIKNNNLAGSWDKLKKSINDSVTTGLVSKFLKDAIDGLLNLGQVFRNLKKEQDEQLRSTAKSIGSNQNLAKSAQTLLNEYESLTEEGVKPTAKEKQRLDEIMLKLRDSLGESIINIDKETGALILNKEAVKDAIKQKLLLANQDAGLLALQANNIAEDIAKKELQVKTEKRILDTRLQTLRDFGVKEKDLRQLMRRDVGAGQVINPDRADASEGNKLLTEFTSQEQETIRAEKELADLQRQRAKILKELAKIGFDATDVQNLFAESVSKTNQETGENNDLTEEQIKAQNELLNAKDKLRIFELEQQAKRASDKADNPANSETIRTKALEDAASARMKIAALERNIALRGDITLADERTLVYRQYAAKIAEIEKDLSSDELAIHEALLSQMADLDKLRLEEEIKTFKAIEENENASYDARQAAAIQVANRLVEIAEIERDEQIRSAKGSTERILVIQQQFTAKVKEISKGVKLFDAGKANDEAEINLNKALLELEKGRALDLEGEKTYQAEKKRLNDEYLQTVIDNLRKEDSESAQALAKELELYRKNNEEKIKSDEEQFKKKVELLRMGLDFTADIGNSIFEINSNGRDADLQNFQINKERELKAAGDNKLAQERIEEDYRKRENAIKLKQAKADRNNALFNIGIRTAQGVASVLSTGGGTYYADFGISAGILSGLVIAQGIAQAAVVLSKPLPQFWRGTKNAPEGFAIVDEQGPELRVSKGKAYLGSNKGPRVTYLNKGDQIYTASQTQKILSDVDKFNQVIGNRQVEESYKNGAEVLHNASKSEMVYQAYLNAQSNAEVVAGLRQVQKAIINRPEHHSNITKGGWEVIKKEGNTITKLLGKIFPNGTM